MKEKIKNTNPQKASVEDDSKKNMKGTSVSEESVDTLKKKDTKELAESPVEKENKK